MIERTEQRFDINPGRPAGDTAYGGRLTNSCPVSTRWYDTSADAADG
jgi:hypothetical protein